MNKILLFFACIYMASVMTAEVYMTLDDNGNPTFTDTPVEGSKKIEVKEVTTIPVLRNAPPPRKITNTAGNKYSQLSILNPKNDETYFRSEGDLVISVSISPRLRGADNLIYYLDGNQVFKGKLTSHSISDMDRGTYTVHISVINGEGDELLSSEPVTFHMRQASSMSR
jgi:hypothetical protein